MEFDIRNCSAIDITHQLDKNTSVNCSHMAAYLLCRVVLPDSKKQQIVLSDTSRQAGTNIKRVLARFCAIVTTGKPTKGTVVMVII